MESGGPVDVAVIGAGPVGLACGIECKRHGLSTRVFDRGAIVNSLLGYPTNMEFFSTPDLLEIGGHPFPTHRYKPVREEAIDYYTGVAFAEGLDLSLYEEVREVEGVAGDFIVVTSRGRRYAASVIVATGFFDIPCRLHVPGEDLPKVTHYYREPYAYSNQDVLVVGAKNSAAKAALDCYRHGARVTLVVRGAELSSSIKYWIKPDLENRIAEGSIVACFNTKVSSISERAVTLRGLDGEREIANDWVLAMTGYRPDYELLGRLGISTVDDEWKTPVYDPGTFETNRPGVFLAGTVCGGLNTSRWFIENGRYHAHQIAAEIASRSADYRRQAPTQPR
jgi:thioredoxin reductase (NADPH)